MKQIASKNTRILAVAPSSKGVGFAVLDGQKSLLDWGVKSVKGSKNAQSIARVKELIAQWQPGALVLQDTSANDSRRAIRIRKLTQQIIALARTHKVRVAAYSRGQVMRGFFANGEGTKHELAKILAQRYPQELGSRLPPKRRPWDSEDSRMDIFDALGLALTLRRISEKSTQG